MIFHWHWFSWVNLGLVDVVCPKQGPFDSRDDAQRTKRLVKLVCAKCGKVTYLRPYWD